MANPIVVTNVSRTVAPTPSTLQKTGALISQGATTLSQGTSALLTQPSDLTAIVSAALANTSLAWATGVVTVTTAAAHGIATSDTFVTTIAGVSPAGYNGTYLATSTGANTFTYPLPGNTPGTETVPGTYTPRNQGELRAMVNTFFAQGATQAVYVLELGAGEVPAGVTELTTYLTANPGTYYAFLMPRSWDANSGFLALAAQYESTTSKTYFYTTSTTGTYSSYTPLMKSIYWLVEAPGIPLTEFSLAGPFWDLLNTSPGATNKVSPFEYTYQFGVTPWPVKNNGVTLTQIKAAGGNYIATGAEGGISLAIVIGGQYADSNPVNYWYAADWAQINVDLNVSNAVINGSNNPINPLYYNQDGINRLEQVAATTMSNGVTFGMVLNPVIQLELDGPALDAALDAGTYDSNTVVNAIPFANYTTENPGDYKIGRYAGFSIAFTPLRGFDQIVFTINVSSFAS